MKRTILTSLFCVMACFGFAQQTITCYTSNDGLADNNSFVTADNNGRILAVHPFVSKISVIDQSNVSTLSFDTTSKGGIVGNIVVGPDNNYYVSIAGGGVLKYDGQAFTLITTDLGLPTNRIHWVAVDSSGAVWATHIYGISKIVGTSVTNFTSGSGLAAGIKFRTYTTKDGRLHVMNGFTTPGPVAVYDGQTWDSIPTPEKAFKHIWSVDVDTASKTTWYGTHENRDVGHGVIKYDASGYKIYDKSDGLLDNRVRGVAYDHVTESAYFATAAGLSALNKQGAWTNYFEKGDLIGSNMSSVVISKGKVWAASSGGVCSIDLGLGNTSGARPQKSHVWYGQNKLNFGTASPLQKVRIYDMNGRLTHRFDNVAQDVYVSLNPGVYVVDYQTSEAEFRVKFVVTNQ